MKKLRFLEKKKRKRKFLLNSFLKFILIMRRNLMLWFIRVNSNWAVSLISNLIFRIRTYFEKDIVLDF